MLMRMVREIHNKLLACDGTKFGPCEFERRCNGGGCFARPLAIGLYRRFPDGLDSLWTRRYLGFTLLGYLFYLDLAPLFGLLPLVFILLLWWMRCLPALSTPPGGCFSGGGIVRGGEGIGDEELIVELQTLPGKELPPWPVSGRAGFSLDSEVLGIHSSWLPLLFGSCASFWVVAPSFHSPFMVDAMLARPLHSSWRLFFRRCGEIAEIRAYIKEVDVYVEEDFLVVEQHMMEVRFINKHLKGLVIEEIVQEVRLNEDVKEDLGNKGKQFETSLKNGQSFG
ncbi:hypothetical protein Tco_0952380 [Tanacetum coccineum]|uniref:Uncharacterized protein n=1 Tax=Tanacetum coccineum TaxID=301880 RepID=A0ABQ5DWX2_9ASTR